MMRKPLIVQILAVFLLSSPLFAELHKFKSADGSKILAAEIVNYDAKKNQVALLLENGRQIYSSITAFSEEDQEYILKVAHIQDIGKTLAVRFVDEEKVLSERKNPLNGYQTLNVDEGYALEIRNNGDELVEGLEADYQVFYRAYLDPFGSRERTEQVKAGSLELPMLSSREEISVSTDGIPMTKIKQLPKSECVGGT